MGSPSVLDFDRLLSPIPGDCPAGAALKDDYSPGAPYYAIKDARSAARAAERSLMWGGDAESGGDRPDWRPVVELGIGILAERSKDLEVAAWLTEALVRRHGYAGLRDGFRLIRALVENFWDDLHPRPDEDGIPTRIAPLTGLNGEEGDGVLVGPIANVPITTAGSYRAMSIADYRQAIDLERIDDAQKRQQRIDHGGVSLQMFETAVSETPLEHFQNIREDLREALDAYRELTSLLEAKCGQDDRGDSLAPPSSSIRNALEECCAHLGNVTKHLFPDDAGETPPASQSAGQPAAAPAGGFKRVETRAEAFQSLLQIAAFFKRTEPHSPVSYALEQAVRWGKLPLPELLSELIADQGSREQLFKLVGIQPPEKP
ncbi:MAG: type VI secretion system protein TssA [Planctomycetota bacterium]|nr:type VI secretion system protein TssA [Planctomycetota bacterium]